MNVKKHIIIFRASGPLKNNYLNNKLEKLNYTIKNYPILFNWSRTFRMRYKHIIWDWNGTLLDDRWLCVEGINQALVKRDLPPISEDRYRKIFTFPVKEYYKKLGYTLEVPDIKLSTI